MPLTTSDSKQDIPAAGTTVQYIPDPKAGWMYIVTTQTNVQQAPITYLEDEIASAQQEITHKQAELATLISTKATVDTAIAEVATITPIK